MGKYLRPIRYGMVGGGIGGFIGHVHRTAASLDGHFELVAGALSSDPSRAEASAEELGIDPERRYRSFDAMAEAETGRPDGIEAVVVVTPNHLHAAPCKAFVKAGIHVICDKPLTATLEEAEDLHSCVKQSDRVFALTHCYSGYPMVRQAREMVRGGELGEIRLVQVEYPQGWLATPLEQTGDKKASWRTDPAQSGPGGCVADIGTHAFHLARFVSGLAVAKVSAELTSFVPDRRVDDNVSVRLRFANGARGGLWASQVAIGHENGLRIRVYGETGALEWVQADPNYMWFSKLGQPRQLLTRAGAGDGPASLRVCRVAAGHPEGYHEAFANIYAEAAADIRARDAGLTLDPDVTYPDIDDGLEGMQFIYACIESSNGDGKWVSLRD